MKCWFKSQWKTLKQIEIETKLYFIFNWNQSFLNQNCLMLKMMIRLACNMSISIKSELQISDVRWHNLRFDLKKRKQTNGLFSKQYVSQPLPLDLQKWSTFFGKTRIFRKLMWLIYIQCIEMKVGLQTFRLTPGTEPMESQG